MARRHMVEAGLEILAQRLRTPYGEIDLLVADDDWVIAVEVKSRSTLRDSVEALQPRQAERLMAAFEYVLATRPDWLRPNTRFDVIAVNREGQARRIMDALRLT
ncbi:MAG: YraN family protein [Gluconobacter sp.]|uniref:YraN family protein n=1 Tax=Gluconobacter sp. TaxID=1876758 RepID=UPI0039EB8A7E